MRPDISRAYRLLRSVGKGRFTYECYQRIFSVCQAVHAGVGHGHAVRVYQHRAGSSVTASAAVDARQGHQSRARQRACIQCGQSAFVCFWYTPRLPIFRQRIIPLNFL